MQKAVIMDTQTEKCVLVIDGTLPLGLIANRQPYSASRWQASAASGGTGCSRQSAARTSASPPPPRTHPAGRTGRCYARFSRELVRAVLAGLTAVDFSDLAQGCRNLQRSSPVRPRLPPRKELSYFGIGICGAKKLVGRLTGNLPLLRLKPSMTQRRPPFSAQDKGNSGAAFCFNGILPG